MYGIDLLVEEHKNIYVLTKHLENVCCSILEGMEVDTQYEESHSTKAKLDILTHAASYAEFKL